MLDGQFENRLKIGLKKCKANFVKFYVNGVSLASVSLAPLRHCLSIQRTSPGSGYCITNSPRHLKTPPQSPDINPIENLWHKLDAEVRKHKISCKDELKRILLQENGTISHSTTKTSVSSMRNRLQAVMNDKGMHTKY
ncbi:tc1-like transposase protein [Trichonephila clavipes]|nr:tc1-like transposase protein [Trichonephila clavipes]